MKQSKEPRVLAPLDRRVGLRPPRDDGFVHAKRGLREDA